MHQSSLLMKNGTVLSSLAASNNSSVTTVPRDIIAWNWWKYFQYHHFKNPLKWGVRWYLPIGICYLECIVSTIWTERMKWTNLSHSSSHRNYWSKVNLIHYFSLHRLFYTVTYLDSRHSWLNSSSDWEHSDLEGDNYLCLEEYLQHSTIVLPCLSHC